MQEPTEAGGGTPVEPDTVTPDRGAGLAKRARSPRTMKNKRMRCEERAWRVHYGGAFRNENGSS